MYNNQKISSRIVCARVLENVQILFQNNEIDFYTKNKITSLLKESLTTNDLSKLNAFLKTLSYGITLKEYLNECIQLTSQEEEIING